MQFKIQNTVLCTPRCTLRAFRQNDLHDFYSYAKVEGVGEMAGWLHHTSIETTQHVLAMFILHNNEFAIEHQGKVIGSLGIYHSDAFAGNGVNIGFVLAKSHHKQGFMSEVLQCIMHYLFTTLDLDFIDSDYFIHNKASRAIHQKFGFMPYGKRNLQHQDGSIQATECVVAINPRLVKATQQSIATQIEQNKNEKRIAFDAKLIPNLPLAYFKGNTLPQLRTLAKSLTPLQRLAFISQNEHSCHDENLLHMFCINLIKEESVRLYYLERFLPYINNWAVCDSSAFKHFKHKELLWEPLHTWLASKEPYYMRMGLLALFCFLDDDHIKHTLALCTQVDDDHYYVHMGLAWLLAEALCLQYEHTLPLFNKPAFSKKTHNKAIQKAVESFRVSEEHKTALKALRIK
ncbi:MAG: GNAT family N-acetyltransferase [Eubacteriales bacterium]|nr:GNAT family N-acetyltransferase [Eubacteriales bacterium]